MKKQAEKEVENLEASSDSSDDDFEVNFYRFQSLFETFSQSILKGKTSLIKTI